MTDNFLGLGERDSGRGDEKRLVMAKMGDNKNFVPTEGEADGSANSKKEEIDGKMRGEAQRGDAESSMEGTWSDGDRNMLFENFSRLGPRWKLIANNNMPTKSENSLKNKFYGAIRKLVRAINKVGKEKIRKYTKPIKYEAVIRILEAAEYTWVLYPCIKEYSERLKTTIINLAQKTGEELEEGEVLELIKEIHRFNLNTRSFSLKKTKLKKRMKKIYSKKRELTDSRLFDSSSELYPIYETVSDVGERHFGKGEKRSKDDGKEEN